ncbi:MAG: hypothetical protein WDZ52_12405 [Pseudohongiellaceae bacterium]
MIPNLVVLEDCPWMVLPPGIHIASIAEIEAVFGYNSHRRKLLKGLKNALRNLQGAGCLVVFLDGSFISDKPIPSDYDGCWDHNGMDRTKLDPVLLDFSNERAAQKLKYYGEFFPAYGEADILGTSFLDFFQADKHTGTAKGIVQLDLAGSI